MSSSLTDTIHNLYQSQKGYTKEYGGSIVLTTILIIVFTLVIVYFYIQSHIKTIRANWEVERCNPLYLPFAGMIYKTNDPIEYTKNNFNQCANSILEEITQYFTQPFEYMFSLMSKEAYDIVSMVETIKKRIEEMAGHLEHIGEEVAKYILVTLLPFQKIVIKMKDTINKIIGTLVVQLYTVFGVYLGIQSFFGAFIEAVILGLLAIIAIVIPLLAGFFTAPLAIPALALFAVIAGILAAILVGLSPIVDVGKYAIPKKPSMPHFCFDSNTPLHLKNGSTVYIKDINIGDCLEDGSTILGVIKLCSSDVDMYEYNGHIISGSHSVWVPKRPGEKPNFIDTNRWKYISDMKSSVKLTKYTKPYIYCLITDTKLISLRHRFKKNEIIWLCDWDEWFRFPNYIYSYTHHTTGLSKNTNILMNDMTHRKIEDIRINDKLYGNNIVLGTIKLQPTHYMFKYPLCELTQHRLYQTDDTYICATPQLQMIDIYNGCRNNTNEYPFHSTMIPFINSVEPIYHLITSEGWICANGLLIEDYNTNLE